MKRIEITAIILAGGQSRRMNYQNKSLAFVLNRPLISYVIDRIKPQVDFMIINANQDLTDYQQFGLPIVSDELSGFLGPLAGIHAGLLNSTTDWNLIVSCDTPNLPVDLVERFCQVSEFKYPVFAVSQNRKHPILMLIHRSEVGKIAYFLKQGQAKPLLFLESIGAKLVDFSDKPEAFINLNVVDELKRFEDISQTIKY